MTIPHHFLVLGLTHAAVFALDVFALNTLNTFWLAPFTFVWLGLWRKNRA